MGVDHLNITMDQFLEIPSIQENAYICVVFTEISGIVLRFALEKDIQLVEIKKFFFKHILTIVQLLDFLTQEK